MYREYRVNAEFTLGNRYFGSLKRVPCCCRRILLFVSLHASVRTITDRLVKGEASQLVGSVMHKNLVREALSVFIRCSAAY
jgi:hypothetical protein